MLLHQFAVGTEHHIFGHTVNTAQITLICERYPQIADVASKPIECHVKPYESFAAKIVLYIDDECLTFFTSTIAESGIFIKFIYFIASGKFRGYLSCTDVQLNVHVTLHLTTPYFIPHLCKMM